MTPAGAKMSTLDKNKLTLLRNSKAANVTEKMREAASVLLVVTIGAAAFQTTRCPPFKD